MALVLASECELRSHSHNICPRICLENWTSRQERTGQAIRRRVTHFSIHLHVVSNMYSHGFKYLCITSIIHQIDSSTENKLSLDFLLLLRRAPCYVVRAGLSPLSAVSTRICNHTRQPPWDALGMETLGRGSSRWHHERGGAAPR